MKLPWDGCKGTSKSYTYYKSIGGLWCRPTVDCPKLGMINGFQITGRTCTKQMPKLWPGIRGTDCPKDRERSGALCYQKCREGYKGNAFVCWGQAPKGWVNCGMGASPSS